MNKFVLNCSRHGQHEWRADLGSDEESAKKKAANIRGAFDYRFPEDCGYRFNLVVWSPEIGRDVTF